MKILHIITTMDPLSGGPCQGIRMSDAELRKTKGVEREVVSLDEPDAEFLGKDEFPIHALGVGKGLWRYNKKLIPWLIENMPRFEVIIVNGLWLYSSYAAWKAMRILGHKASDEEAKKKLPKIFVMPHGMLDPYFQKAADRKLKAIRNWIYWHLIEHRVVNDAYGLLFTCETELRLARQAFGNYHPNKEINVSYGIKDPPQYTIAMQNAFKERCRELGDNNYLLFLSRLHKKKGVDMLLEAYSKIINEYVEKRKPFPNLVIAGPGLETPFGREIRKLVFADKNLKKFVFFTGMLAGEAKWGAFYGCEAFILPSHQENFGIAVAEALSCSKPVLISNQINIWKEITNYKGGLIEDDTLGGTDALLRKWIEMSDPQKKEMGINALRTFKNNFAIEPAANLFLDALYS